MAGATWLKRRALQNWLLVWRENGISHDYPARTHSNLISFSNGKKEAAAVHSIKYFRFFDRLSDHLRRRETEWTCEMFGNGKFEFIANSVSLTSRCKMTCRPCLKGRLRFAIFQSGSEKQGRVCYNVSKSTEKGQHGKTTCSRSEHNRQRRFDLCNCQFHGQSLIVSVWRLDFVHETDSYTILRSDSVCCVQLLFLDSFIESRNWAL